MPSKYRDLLLENYPHYGARVVQPARSEFYTVYFRGRQVAQFKTQSAAVDHMHRLIKELARARRTR